jgi:hypothetical protein
LTPTVRFMKDVLTIIFVHLWSLINFFNN